MQPPVPLNAGNFGPGTRKPRATPLLRTMLGDVLRRIRREQGRTLADVARAAKVSMPYLSELERGRKEASSEVLAAICAALGVELGDLLTEVGRDLTASAPAQVIRLNTIRPEQAAPASSPAGISPSDIVSLLAA
jgi:transcriptional regulator with XRE-family HTH domain